MTEPNASFFSGNDESPAIDQQLADLQGYVDLARAWAIQLGTPVEGSDWSSKYYSLQAAESATAAEAAQTAAEAILAAIEGQSLGQHTDTLITSPANGQALVWDSVLGKWINDNVLTSISITDISDISSTPPDAGDVLVWDGSEYVPRPAGSLDVSEFNEFIIKCGGESRPVAVNSALVTFWMMRDFDLRSINATLNVAQSSGSTFTIDVKVNGSSAFSTLLTIDNGEQISWTAATPAVLSLSTINAGQKVQIAVTQIGAGDAAGLKVYLVGHTPADGTVL